MAVLPDDDDYATVVHDLKTPVAVAIALCSAAAATDDVDQLHDDVLEIGARLQGIARQLDLLLERARVRALPETRADTDLAALVRECVTTLAPLAAARGIALTVVAPAALPAHIQAERCAAAVTNLVANALRHAREGGTVRLRLARSPGWAQLEVADDGPGVPATERDRLFEPFRTLGLDAAQPGRSGLGLAIVRDVAVRQGGSVEIRTATGGGALFVLRVPLGASAPQSPAV